MIDFWTLVSLILFLAALYASARFSEGLVRFLLAGRGRRPPRPGPE